MQANLHCAFCRFPSGWLDLYFIDNNPRNFARDNLCAACPLCRCGQSLHRPTIAREFLPVWLPEFEQIAIIRLTRLLHHRLFAAGEPPIIDQHHRPLLDDPTTRQLVSTYLGFANRRVFLGVVLNGYAPTARELITLFYHLDVGRGHCPERLAEGLRLLPLGRYFQDDQDCYAEALGWRPPTAITPADAQEAA